MKILLFLLLISANASAICIQHDIPVEKYEEFGRAGQFAAVGKLTDENGNCTATLIDPYTVLTAAHCLVSHLLWFHPEYNLEFQLGTETRKAIAIRNMRMFGLFGRAEDIAIAYLEEPIHHVEFPRLARRPSANYVDKEVDFAGFGATLVADGASTELVRREKLAGKSDILFLEKDQFVGFFDHNESVGYLNAHISFGDSGAALFLSRDSEREIVGVLTHSGPCEYEKMWFAVPVFAHLAFIDDAMAYKQVDTRRITPSDWDDIATWQTSSEKKVFREAVGNRQEEDQKHGSKLRRFDVRIKGKVSLNHDVSVDSLKLEDRGSLAVAANAALNAKTISIDDASVTFAIADAQHAIVQAKNVDFQGATINVDFRMIKGTASSNELTLRRPPMEQFQPKSRYTAFLMSGAQAISSSVFSLFSSKAPVQRKEWKLVKSELAIKGVAQIRILNCPQNYEISSEQSSNEVIIRAVIY